MPNTDPLRIPSEAYAWPPPPHDPRERVFLLALGEWEVRAFAEDDPKHLYMAPRRFLHLQLWHPGKGVSVLTPSRLTAARFEAFPIRGWKHQEVVYEALEEIVREEHRLSLPGPIAVRALLRWFVERWEKECRNL